jgi:RNA polymerase-binding transcription factor DksA
MADTNTYKHTLETLLDEIITELESIAEYRSKQDDWVAKPATKGGEADANVEADLVEDWNERRASLSELETRYQNIKRALRKIEDGTFGVCEISNEPIEEDRLEANPAARTCKAHLDQEQDLPL